MNFSRLYQPRNPRFWVLVALNVPSAGITYILHHRELPVTITLVLTACAIANFLIGLRIARQLLNQPSQE